MRPFADYLTVSEASCGGDENKDGGAGTPTVTYDVGATISVTYDITISHNLEPGVRIAIRDTSDANSKFTDNILYDFSDNSASDADSGEHTIEVDLPAGFSCANCELQQLWASESDGGFYIGCADVTVGSVVTTGTTTATDSAAAGNDNSIIDSGLSAFTLDSVQTHTIVAAVMLPIGLTAVFAGLYMLRHKVAAMSKSREVNAKTLLQAIAGIQYVSCVLLIAIMASASWTNANFEDVTSGLFRFCHADECITMSAFDPNAAALIEAVQAFVILTFLSCLASAAAASLLIGEQNNSLPVQLKACDDAPRLKKTLTVLSGLSCLFVFLSICLYSAYFYDIMLPAFVDAFPGWGYDLLGMFWLLSIASFGMSYRLGLELY